MKRLSPREYDYAFGQMMLTLRSAVGLTQVGLAAILGVSRRSVGDWESGSSYPKAEHLKQFITLAMEQRAFHVGREDEEIRALWKISQQKALLDEGWLAALLTPQQQVESKHMAAPPVPLPRKSRVDWGDALSVPTFYGREWELNLLTGWVVEEHCRMISVLGMGGIGKSALVVTLMRQLTEQFEVIVWHSLRDAPTLETLLEKCVNVIAAEATSHMPDSLEEQLELLLEYLRKQRTLLVLDNLETLLEEGEGSGRMRAGYEGYGRLLQRLAESDHQSCILLTSREKPEGLSAQEGSRSPVRVLRLAQLDVGACEQLLAEKNISGSASEQGRLIEAYTGNPLAIKIVMQTIVDLFDGEIGLFLEQGEVIYGDVRELLNQHFMRLSSLEQSVLLWLAILREPAALDELLRVLVTPVPKARILEAIESLFRRSLIERGQRRGSFTLQSVVLEYVTSRIVSDASEAIQARKPSRILIEHGFELAQGNEHVRQTQTRLILIPILTLISNLYGQSADIEALLMERLNQVRESAELAQSYAPANLIALLRLHRGHLRELDLSGLVLRSVHLQGVEMQDASLSDSLMYNSVFTETFDIVTAVAVSEKYWAGATIRGEVRVWSAEGRTLHQVWQAHSDMISALSFDPEGRTLVTSGGSDGTVKLWEVASGALLWTGSHPRQAYRVAISPDGRFVASSGIDASVRLWDLVSGVQIETLPHPCPVIAIAWSLEGYLFATGDEEGCVRLWDLHKTGTAACIHTFTGHTSWVDGLAFDPSGRFLASASWDGTVKLWDVRNGCLQQTLTSHTERVCRVAWSPDGRILASGGFEKTIRLWDMEQSSYRAALQGHTAGIADLTFTPDGHNLLSSSEDGTMRLWNVANGQCLRVMQGYMNFINDIDWSPDSTQLVSGGSDPLVTIYSVTGATPPRTLQGHTRIVFGVGWSPDGRYLASSEWNNIIRLWDPNQGVCLHVLQHPDYPANFFDGLAWSPDGQRLACATYERGVEVFEMTTNRRWAGEAFPAWIHQVAWHVDGTLLAGGGDDGIVYVWDSA
ncbi:MAG: helix-turn-helix domain-containing protein, partial [Anaerolineae bacterium]|nr:helix-turn-helix domain-containing protein [Anaerolineae bacterium]